MDKLRITLGNNDIEKGILESGMLEGEQVHINHEDCPAGTDTKKRLYIKRTDKGFVAYCHHCQGVGYKLDKEPSYRRVETLSKLVEDPPYLSSRGEVDYRGWHQALSLDAKMYLDQYGITAHDAAVLDIRDRDGWVCFPIYRGRNYNDALEIDEDRLLSFNATIETVRDATFRKLTNKAYKKSGDLDFHFGDDASVIVLVEDFLSAYIVMKHAKCISIPLFGTHLSPSNLMFIKSCCDASIAAPKIVVWLDDDVAGKEAALSMAYQLKQLRTGYVKVLSKTEPKLIPNHLREEIYQWVRE